MQTAIAITNDQAGTTSDEAADSALEVLRRAYDIRVVSTGNAADLDAALAEGEVVIVMGGDGSLRAVVASLGRLDRLEAVSIGIIPLGTGNDFAHSLNIPDDPAEAARLITAGETLDVDLLSDDLGEYVVNAVHLGAGAEAAERSESWKEALGPVGYSIGAAVAGIDTGPLDVQVSVDGTALPAGNGVLQVAINNGKFVGAGTPMAPDADPTDGLLDITVSYATGPAERLAYGLALRTGDHVSRDDVITARGTTVSVHGEPFTCSADGEIEENIRERTWTVVPGALSIFASAVAAAPGN